MGEKPWHDAETLARLYYQEQLSLRDMGDELGTTAQTVRNWMDKYGMERRDAVESHTTDTPELLTDGQELRHELVDKERTHADLADELGVSVATISTYRHKHGITETPNNRTVVTECAWCGAQLHRGAWRVDRHPTQFCDDDCRGAWLSENATGEDNPNYRGGHHEYGPTWNDAKKRTVRERDGHECQVCGISQDRHLVAHNERLHVHHIQRARSFDDHEKRNAVSNLITLCRDCHRKWEGVPLAPDSGGNA